MDVRRCLYLVLILINYIVVTAADGDDYCYDDDSKCEGYCCGTQCCGLPVGTIIGITIGALMLLALTVGVCFVVCVCMANKAGKTQKRTGRVIVPANFSSNQPNPPLYPQISYTTSVTYTNYPSPVASINPTAPYSSAPYYQNGHILTPPPYQEPGPPPTYS